MGVVMDKYMYNDRYDRAKKRVEKIKGFYWHFASYFIVNMFISCSKIVSNMNSGESFSEAFFDFGTFALWMFWGIGIFFHAFGVFGKHLLFGEKWESRKIQEFMEKEKQKDNKWQ